MFDGSRSLIELHDLTRFFLKAYCSFYRILYIFSSLLFTTVFLLFGSVIFGHECLFLAYIRVLRTYLCSNRIV